MSAAAPVGAADPAGASPAAWRALAPHLAALDVTDKGWGPALAAAGPDAAGVPLTDASTPVLALDVAAAERNLLTMQAWASDRGALLAPHGKTTMTPGLWHWQLGAGAWAITVATEAQLRVARTAGVRRVVVANQLVHGRWSFVQLVDPHHTPDLLNKADYYQALATSTSQ